MHPLPQYTTEKQIIFLFEEARCTLNFPSRSKNPMLEAFALKE
jgi:hypothetical protein